MLTIPLVLSGFQKLFCCSLYLSALHFDGRCFSVAAGTVSVQLSEYGPLPTHSVVISRPTIPTSHPSLSVPFCLCPREVGFCWPSCAALKFCLLTYCHSLSLASVKSRLVLPFWYRLTRVVPDKGTLNGCVCVCVCVRACVRACVRVCVY